MRAGSLTRRVTLLKRSDGPADAHGEPRPRWATLAVVWAGVVPLSGREAWQARQTQSTVTHAITVRYSAASITLSPRDAVAWGVRWFEIESVLDVNESQRTLTLSVHEDLSPLPVLLSGAGGWLETGAGPLEASH